MSTFLLVALLHTESSVECRVHRSDRDPKKQMRALSLGVLLFCVSCAHGFLAFEVTRFPRAKFHAGRFLLTRSKMSGSSLFQVDVTSSNVTETTNFLTFGCGLKVHRESSEATFLGFSSEVGDFSFKLVEAAVDLNSEKVLIGFSFSVENATKLYERAVALHAEIVYPISNVTYVASMFPDEDIAISQPWLIRAVVKDPFSGLEIEITESSSQSIKHSSLNRIDKVSFRVSDLDEAIQFHTSVLGMKLHRKRSLVPVEAAMSAFLNFATDERDNTLLELRYLYGKSYGQTKVKDQVTSALIISTSDIESTWSDVGMKASIPRKDVNIPLRLYHQGISIEFIDELELLKLSLG